MHRTVAAATQQVQEAVAQEERRASGAAASTTGSRDGSSNGNGRALAAVLERPAQADPAPGVNRQPQGQQGQRNTAVDVRFKPFLDEWDKGFVETEEEPEGYWMDVVAGEVPQELQGTLFR